MELKAVNKKRIKAWVEALRSGEYKQTKGHLHDKKGFCCLGVAADLYVKSHKGCSWQKRRKVFHFIQKNHEEWWYLSPPVASWFFGPSFSVDPFVTYKGIQEFLTGCNDRYKLSFEKIADLIEAEYLSEKKEEKKV